MPTTFSDADEYTCRLGKQILQQHHPELVAVDLTVTYKFARGPLKLHGYPAAAIIKITSYDQRSCHGADDVILKIEESGWKEMTERQQLALLRHEFFHLILKRDKEGQPKLDDCGRPRLEMRLHDLVIGGFEQIVKEYGRDCQEAKMIEDVFRSKQVQGVLNWG